MTLNQVLINRRATIKRSLALAGGLVSLPPALALAQQGHAPNQATPAPNQATPAADDAPIPVDQFPLTGMLSCIPQSMLAEVSGEPYWYYADVQQQLVSLGLHHDSNGPDLENEPASAATLALTSGGSAMNFAMVEEFTDAIGFNPLGMNQNLAFGTPPDVISIYRGEFDADALLAAWEQSGYQPAETIGDIPAWTIGPDGEFEVENPVQQFVIAAMNNVAIVDDMLIYTGRLATLNKVLDHMTAGTPSVVDDEVFGPLLGTLPQTFVSGMGLGPILGTGLSQLAPEQASMVNEDLDAIRDEVGPMPTATGMIVGVSAGAVPIDFEWNDLEISNAGTMFVRIGCETPEDAEQVANVVVARAESLPSIATGAPLSDLIVPESHEAEGTTAKIDLIQLESPRIWYSMILNRDVLLFLPDEDE